MPKTMHVSLDVRGALKWPKRLRAKLFLNDDGTHMTADEATDALLDALAAGYEQLPVGDECDDFDPKTGCRGHHITTGAPAGAGRGA